jgi:large conductance mechanosensitive channel
LTPDDPSRYAREIAGRATSMWQEFKAFLTKTNALALAVGVVIGAAVGNLVSSIVKDLLMPIVGLALPPGDWRKAMLVLSESPTPGGEPNAIRYGNLLGNAVDFVIIAFVVFWITKMLLREKPKAPPPAMKDCPFCLASIPQGASKCQACTSALPA